MMNCKQSNVKISVVIPMYNCGSLIHRCLDSVYAQGLNDDEFEVIVINDGSTDNGCEIVVRYCAEHTNLILYSQENKGVSAARNKGIELAAGQYLHFVDADDELVRNGYKMLLSYIGTEGNDIVIFSSVTIDAKIDSEKNINNSFDDLKITSYNADVYLQKYNFPTFVWTNFYKRDILLNNSVFFDDICFAEDALFNISFFCKCHSIEMVKYSGKIYKYYLREGSGMTRRDKHFLRRCLRDLVKNFEIVKSYSLRKPQYSVAISHCVDGWKRKYLTRILSGCFPLNEIKSYVKEAKRCGFISGDKSSEPGMLTLLHYPFLVWLISPLYRYVFLTCIKPNIARN